MRKQAILISEEVFRELSPLPGTFDYKYLKPHILSAQDQHIQPVLGSKLYFDLQAKTYDGTLSTDEQNLLNDYIAKVMVYFSLYAAASFLSVKFENTGIVQKTTNDTTSITLTDADKLAEKLLSSAEFYKQRLIDFLQFNKDTYPLYDIAANDDIPASTENFRGFFSYDDYEEPNYPATTGGGGGGEGTTDHRQLTAESRNANDQHIIDSVTGLRAELDALLSAIQTEALRRITADNLEAVNREANDALIRQDLEIEEANRTAADVAIIDAFTAKDDSLQEQILTMQENDPMQQIRYLTSDPIVLNTETFYQSKADKGTAPAFEITTLITATTPVTADIVAQWVGVALTQPLELIDQITSLLIKARKDRTGREITLFAEFYDYTAAGVKTLKGTSSQVILTDTTTAYDLYFPIQAYLAAIGSRGLIVVKAFQDGTDPSADAILVIEGDYYSRWSYTLPAGSLSFLDEKVTSTQDLPNIGALAGESQKDVNLKLANRVERGITIDGGSVVVVRDYYSAQASITEATGRGVTLIERSIDNITFVTATPPFNVTGDIYWRITPSTEKSFVKIKGQLV